MSTFCIWKLYEKFNKGKRFQFEKWSKMPKTHGLQRLMGNIFLEMLKRDKIHIGNGFRIFFLNDSVI